MRATDKMGGVTSESVRMLATVLAMAAGAWVGGLVTVTLVVVSSQKLGASDRVALFRTFGRRFALFFGITAIFVVVPAVILAAIVPHALSTAGAVLSVLLLVATGFGIAQAKRMTAMRTALAAGGASEISVKRNATVAATIRAVLVVGYVALLVIAILLSSAA